MATYVYDDFRVALAARSDGAYDVRAVGADGVVHIGSFRVPFDDAELEQAVLGVARGPVGATRDIGGGAGPPALDAEVLGAALADALLTGEVAAGYDAARRRAAEAGRGLRLTLSLAAAPRLLSVPWELLYRRPRFLANQRHTPLVRHLDTAPAPRPPDIEGPVRLLGVVASPSDTSPLDVTAERARVEQAVAEVVALGRVELDWLEPATPRRLREALRDGSYHVLHFVGHSDFTPAGEGVLYLEDPDGGHAELDSTELANLLSDQTSLRLVVLNSCEGARTTLTDPFAGVATTLVQLGVPAVVAMQFEISDAAAILFADELYTNLIGRQDPIDAAVAEARKAIYIELGTVEWATPVLFMGDTDVTLFRFAIAAAPLPPPPPPELAPGAAPDISTSPPPGPLRRRRRSPTAGLVGLAALVIVGLVLFALVRRGVEDDAAADPTTTPAPPTATATATGVSGNVGAPSTVPVAPVSGRRFTGEITAPEQSIAYPIELQAGQLLYLDGTTPCGAQVAYRLVSPSGVQNGGYPYVCQDLGRTSIGETGTWNLYVESYGGGIGIFDVELSPIPPDAVQPVVVGQRIGGEITEPGEHHTFVFAGAAGDDIYVDAAGPCDGVAYSIVPPGGGSTLAGLPYACADTDRTVLPATGEYTISVESYQGGIGIYDLTLLAVPDDVATPIAVGDEVRGDITAPGQRLRYPFTAAANDVVAVDALGACGPSVAYFIETPSGVEVGGALPYVCADLEPEELTETGTFTLVVESYQGGVGSFGLRLHAVS
ncbi:MAG: CHAT domain-containing protein [Ilumatobacteraceae bacterium]